jgi:general secretion pathway protein G
VYLVPGPDGLPYDLLTYGADGEPGGTGENADLGLSAM